MTRPLDRSFGRMLLSTLFGEATALLMSLGGLASRSFLVQPLLAQSAPASTPTDSNAGTRRPGGAAPPIAVAEVARDLTAFSADSLRSRGTPSAGLTAAAAYVAAEFQRLGLSPEVQTYPLPGQQRVDAGASQLMVTLRLVWQGKRVVGEDGDEPARDMSPSFRTDVYFAPEVGPQTIKMKRYSFAEGLTGAASAPLTLLAGPYAAAAVQQLADTLRHKTVLYVPPADADTVAQRQVIAALYAVAQGVVVAGASDSARFAAAGARAPEAKVADEYLRLRSQDWNPWAVVVNGARVGHMLAALGEDLERLRTSAIPILRPLALRVRALIHGNTDTDDVLRGPNVIATLPGSDSAWRDDYVVIVAPLDTRRDGDVNSAAAGLLALARAFTQPGQRPRRSIVFLAASGGAHEEFWGAKYFAYTMTLDPRKSVALAFGRLGGWPGDSALVSGLRDVEVTPALTWVTRAHPELDLRIVDGGAAVEPLADQFAFVRKTMPSLYVHATDDAVDDARPAAADAEQVVRGTRLVFALAEALANADRRPRWSTQGRQQLRSLLDP